MIRKRRNGDSAKEKGEGKKNKSNLREKGWGK
jgi:hypothetical protein